MKVYSLDELVKCARSSSPYYKELYKDVGANPRIEDLPILDSSAFWTANKVEQNKVLTADHTDGIIFKSGGTSGNPKFSFFTKEEWRSFTQAFGEGMTLGGLNDGDRIANLFYAGDLYASFLFIMGSIEASEKKLLHFPLSGSAEIDHILTTMDEFKIDIWAGVPTTIMKVAEFAKVKNVFPPKKILFGGESFYPDQRKHLASLFPGVIIQSIGYASVDGGLLGYVDSECKPQEHRVFSDYTILEIIDEDNGKKILEVGRAGKVVLTNLTRKLMPIIRYPVGDRAEWVDPSSITKNRKYKILGRSEEGARIGPATVYYDDVASFLDPYHQQLQATGFQLIIRHFDQLDQLVVIVATHVQDHGLSQKMALDLENERSFLKELADQGKIHRVSIQFVQADKLAFQPRTGKLRRIIDERF